MDLTVIGSGTDKLKLQDACGRITHFNSVAAGIANDHKVLNRNHVFQLTPLQQQEKHNTSESDIH